MRSIQWSGGKVPAVAATSTAAETATMQMYVATAGDTRGAAAGTPGVAGRSLLFSAALRCSGRDGRWAVAARSVPLPPGAAGNGQRDDQGKRYDDTVVEQRSHDPSLLLERACACGRAASSTSWRLRWPQRCTRSRRSWRALGTYRSSAACRCPFWVIPTRSTPLFGWRDRRSPNASGPSVGGYRQGGHPTLAANRRKRGAVGAAQNGAGRTGRAACDITSLVHKAGRRARRTRVRPGDLGLKATSGDKSAGARRRRGEEGGNTR